MDLTTTIDEEIRRKILGVAHLGEFDQEVKCENGSKWIHRFIGFYP